MIRTFKDHDTGDTFRFDFRRKRTSGGYVIYCLAHPYSPYELGHAAHLHEGDVICVLPGREPKSLERAKAIAFAWMRGFSHYIRTGDFPNGPARVNVAES